MQTLSFGYQKPENGDNGGDFFPALADNIQQCNDHTHNGSNSPQLTSTAIVPVSQTILAAGWSATSGGTYRQLVTCPAGITYDAYGLFFKLSSSGTAGHAIYPSVERVSSTTFYVYTNDSTIDVLIHYLV